LLHINSILVSPIAFDEEARQKVAAEQGFEADLETAFRAQLGVRVLSSRDLTNPAKLPSDALQRSVESGALNRPQALRLAQEQKADALLETVVHRYVEREGSGVGVEQPANISFSISLLAASSGREIWYANYNFKDQALSENLFKASNRGEGDRNVGWKRASDLLIGGFEKAARDLSERRSAQFVSGASAPEPSSRSGADAQAHDFN
jgi:hypothetical protein